MKGKVIVLLDDNVLAAQIATVLRQHQYSVLCCSNSDSLFEEVRGFIPDILLIDAALESSRLTGLQVLRYLRDNLDFNYKVIVLTQELNTGQLDQIRELGVFHYVEKGTGFSLNQLLLNIDNALSLKRQEEQNLDLQIEYLNLKKQFTRSFPFIGESAGITRVRSQLLKFAAADEDILILGEDGTGKEVAANYYYVNSPRFGQPFHTLYCSSLADSMIEKELLGRGKLTGTEEPEESAGYFERCSTGILFMDEITHFSLQSQAKILRAIENKEIPSADGASKKVNTRLIFTSNADLKTFSDPTLFRKDLFYRIEGNVVRIPPLRERGDDILLLMSYFFTNYANFFPFRLQVDLSPLKPELLSYSWPGNVRELKNFCKNISISERQISSRTILQHLHDKLLQSPAQTTQGIERYYLIQNIRDSTAAFERDFIRHFLPQYGWSVSRTANAIGLERTTLYKKIKALDINLQDGSGDEE